MAQCLVTVQSILQQQYAIHYTHTDIHKITFIHATTCKDMCQHNKLLKMRKRKTTLRKLS